MKVLQAIEVINRRAKTLHKLFGTGSPEYNLFTALMSKYDVTAGKGKPFHLLKNKANRAEYRKLVAWAKQIQKTPYAVLKRKADRKWKQVEQDYFEGYYDDISDEILDHDTYNKWLSQFANYFESCYDLATRNGYRGYVEYQFAEYLYHDYTEYQRQWNYFFQAGAFSEMRKSYFDAETKQVYDIDPETGEMIERSDFYREV